MRTLSSMAAVKQRTETLVGIFIFTGIAFLTWLILSLGELGSRFPLRD